MIEKRKIVDRILSNLEDYRYRLLDTNQNDKPDYVIRVCEAIVAEEGGYNDRTEWRHCQKRG
jgi:hypothetical protein